jgi:hypothetical protein
MYSIVSRECNKAGDGKVNKQMHTRAQQLVEFEV